jgi:hypothetical protein
VGWKSILPSMAASLLLKAICTAQPFFLKDKAVVKSMAYDPASGSQSETSNKTFDISKQLWRAVGTNAQGSI